MTEREEEHTYDIAMETGLDPIDGKPMVLLNIGVFHGEEKMFGGRVARVDLSAMSARTFAINLLMSTFDVESRSSVVAGMRANKLDEDVISAVLDETDKITHARRTVG